MKNTHILLLLQIFVGVWDQGAMGPLGVAPNFYTQGELGGSGPGRIRSGLGANMCRAGTG